MVAAAVGPVTARPLLDLGCPVIIPDRYRLGALIRLVSQHLTTHCVLRFERAGVVLELRGHTLTVGGAEVTLGPNALALFRRPARAEGVVSRAELVAALPENPSEHALEVAMSRLRRALPVPGLITTVVKRGYVLNAVRLPGS